MSDQVQVQALTQRLKSSPQTQNVAQNPASVQKAWDGAKGMAQANNVNPTDPDYWDKVTQQTKQSMGIFPDESEKVPTSGEGSRFGFKPAPAPVAPPKPTDQPKPVFEGYEPFSKALKKSVEEPQYQGLTKEELAKELIKKLRKDGRSDNEITNSLVNRMLFDFKTASDLVGLKDGPVEPKDPYANGQLPEAFRGAGYGRVYSRNSAPRKGARDSEETSDADQAYNAEIKRKRKEKALAKKQAK